MAVSVFDLFKIGIGPSSSHTVGPMRAARMFALRLAHDGLLSQTTRVVAELYGSLGATGKGHGSDKAVLLGLEGDEPDTVDVEAIAARIAAIRGAGRLRLLGLQRRSPSTRTNDLLFYRASRCRFTPTACVFTAFDSAGARARAAHLLLGRRRLRGQRRTRGRRHARAPDRARHHGAAAAVPLGRAAARAVHAASGVSIAGIMRVNERHWRDDAQIDAELDRIWAAMQACVERGCAATASCPAACASSAAPPRCTAASRRCTRRAPRDPLEMLDWVNLFALAVNEENAAGGRVVTAPTNGAAGIVPAVLHYYARHVPGATRGRARLPAHRRRDRHPLQGERVDLGRRGRLPGRGRRRLLDGGGRACARCSAARRRRSRTPPRSAWSTTSA